MLRRIVIRRLAMFIVLIVTAVAGGFSAGRQRLAVASEPPVLPSEVVARPGRLTLIRANSAARVCWHVCPAAQSPDILPLTDGKELVFVAAAAGRYELIAWTAGSDGPTEAAHCVVRVEPEKPPVPPDPLAAKLRAAWAAETDPLRVMRRDLLAGIYRTAIEDTIRQPALHTVGDLFTALRQAAKAVLPDDALPQVRGAIAEELRKSLPVEPEVELDTPTRERCVTVFRRIADGLMGLANDEHR